MGRDVLTPDSWVVVEAKELSTGNEYQSVLSGWAGSYLYGSSWRLSTPIDSVEEEGDNYRFVTTSGTTYLCRKGGSRMTMDMTSQYASLKKLTDYDVNISTEYS